MIPDFSPSALAAQRFERACPWAHRTVIGRRLKGLEDVIGMSVVDAMRDERGWTFSGGEYVDSINGFTFLGEAYEATEPDYEGRFSVPVLRTHTGLNPNGLVAVLPAADFTAPQGRERLGDE